MLPGLEIGLVTNTLLAKLLELVAGEDTFEFENLMLGANEELDAFSAGLVVALVLKLKFKLFIKGSISDLGFGE